MRYHVAIGARSFIVDLGTDGVVVDGRPVEASLAHGDGSPLRGLLIDGRSHRVVAERLAEGSWALDLGGTRIDASVMDGRTKAIRDAVGAGRSETVGPRPIVAPMPGMVVKVEVVEGDVVEAGQGVVIVEAMKMENELRAEGVGVVTRVHATRGQAVEKGQVLVELAPVEGEGT